nr:MAG TPA: hypothetical protein [Caudoviricetes sp.]
MIEKIIYIAEDGTQFDFEEDCIAHENAALYSDPEIKNEIFCFNRDNKRYFPASFDDFENLNAFYCETERAYELLKKIEELACAKYLPFEDDSREPEEYEKEKATFVKTHWLWGICDDYWTCLEYEEELLKKRMKEQDKRIQEEKEKGIGEE